MEGESFLTINPYTFSDTSIWVHRDLQKLCKKLGLKANGGRQQLVNRLSVWHRSRDENDQCLVKDHENNECYAMNTVGNNFSLLKLNIIVRDEKKSKKRHRSSIIGLDHNDQARISPTSLRPLKECQGGTTPKSILKCRIGINEKKRRKEGKMDKIVFSPYNSVKFIAHRLSSEDEN